MLTSLWLNIAEYKVKIKNTSWDQYNSGFTEYPITEDEYDKLKLAIHNKEPFTWIHDLMWVRLREINPKRDIKEFLPIIHSKQDSWKVVICSFWWRHSVAGYPDNCDCSKIFWCVWFVFNGKLKEFLWLDIYYDSDITEDIRKNYLLALKNE